MLYCFVTQKSRYRRNGHCGLEEHDLVSPAPDRGGLPRTGHAATTDPPHRAAAQACEAGLVRHRPVRAPARARAPAPAPPPPLYQRHATRPARRAPHGPRVRIITPDPTIRTFVLLWLISRRYSILMFFCLLRLISVPLLIITFNVYVTEKCWTLFARWCSFGCRLRVNILCMSFLWTFSCSYVCKLLLCIEYGTRV